TGVQRGRGTTMSEDRVHETDSQLPSISMTDPISAGLSSSLPRLEVRGLTKSYRRRVVLRSLDMSVHAGDAVALIGRNGAGKSTLLGCITGDRLPDRGEIRVCGADPFSDPVAVAKCMGFVPEQPFLYGELTI